MRTTIEIRDDLRGALLDLAAKRGQKGFSPIVEEAIEAFLASERGREDARRRALLTRGILDDDEAESLRERTAALRGQWR